MSFWPRLDATGESLKREPLTYRAIAFRTENHLWWFWIGSHEDYNKVLNRVK